MEYRLRTHLMDEFFLHHFSSCHIQKYYLLYITAEFEAKLPFLSKNESAAYFGNIETSNS